LSLVLFLIVVTFFAYRGYKKGLFKSIVKVSSLIAGYAATILYISPVSSILEVEFQLSAIVAFFIASTVLFMGAFLFVSLLFGFFGKLWPKEKGKSAVPAIGGAVMGALVGTLIAIVLVWAFTVANNMRPVAPGQVLIAKPSSLIETMAKHVVSRVAEIVMSAASTSSEVKSLSQAMITKPGEVSQQIQRLTKSYDLTTLFGDPNNQAVLDSGDASAVRQLPAFQRLIENPDMLGLAKSAGMFGETGDDIEMAKAALAAQTTNVWGRVQQVKNNQRVNDIMNDPKFASSLKSGSPIDLLTNSKLLELVNIIFADKKLRSGSESSAPQQPSPDIVKKAAKIYSWTDDQGQIFYSNIDPKP
jgi:uncharacterized membrane protein required for colicin V production